MSTYDKQNGRYLLNGSYTEEALLGIADLIISERFYTKDTITSPSDMKRYLTLRFRDLKREEFCIIFLDASHHIRACETVFTGTIDSAAIYPREVVRKVIEHNAHAVVFAHNHPSGNCEPSTADELITTRLVEALKLINVSVLDHIIVGGANTMSFAERGLM